MAPQTIVVLEEARKPRAQPKREPDVDGKTQEKVAITPSAPVRAEMGHAHRTIAIVEDQKELLSTYASIFKALGWTTVFIGAKGEDLVSAAKKELPEPDIVIMDYRLPGIDGIEAARQLSGLIPGIKIVITTADGRVRRASEEAGFLFLQKPFSMSVLVEFLSGL
jgi:CheY-like chemotaxis protein